jgi:integrase
MDELKKLWSLAEPRNRYFITLALNCGMGQKDIADLKMNEVDWERGYVERDRSKTNIRAKHKLCPVALELLKAQRRTGAGPEALVFVGRNGFQMVRCWIEGSRERHSDAIKNAFDRLLKKAGLNGGRGFYCLQKRAWFKTG